MEAEIISLEVRNRTVDARNPAPVEVVYPIICRFFYTSQVVSRISSNSIYKHSLFFLSTHCQGRCFRWYSYVVQIEHPKCFFCIHPWSHSTVDGRNPCNPLDAKCLHFALGFMLFQLVRLMAHINIITITFGRAKLLRSFSPG